MKIFSRGFIVTFASFLMAASVLLAEASSSQEKLPQKETIKIGVICPLTGNMESLGKIFQDAGMLAIKEAQAQPTRFKYEIIWEDDQCQNRLTNLAAQKLITQDRVNALVTFSAGPGNVVKPLAARAGIVHFNDSFDTTVADRGLNFVHTTPPALMAKRWIALAKEKGWKRVAVAEVIQQGVKATVDAIEAECKGSGVTLIRDFKFVPGERDFRTFIVKMREAKPDAIFVMALLPEIEIVGRQIREQDAKIPLTSVWSFDVLQDRAPYVGSFYVSTGMPTESFQEEFKKAYNYTSAGDQLNCYDYIKILVAGFESAKSKGIPSGVEVAVAIRAQKNFPSLMGHVECTPQNVFLSPTSAKQVTKEGNVVLKDLKK